MWFIKDTYLLDGDEFPMPLIALKVPHATDSTITVTEWLKDKRKQSRKSGHVSKRMKRTAWKEKYKNISEGWVTN